MKREKKPLPIISLCCMLFQLFLTPCSLFPVTAGGPMKTKYRQVRARRAVTSIQRNTWAVNMSPGRKKNDVFTVHIPTRCFVTNERQHHHHRHADCCIDAGVDVTYVGLCHAVTSLSASGSPASWRRFLSAWCSCCVSRWPCGSSASPPSSGDNFKARQQRWLGPGFIISGFRLSTAPLRQARSSLKKRRRKPAQCAYQNTSME